MGFKLKGAPYDKSNMNIAVYKKDLTDGSIGKSNHTGIILKTGLDPETEQHVIAHEKVHQEQQARNKESKKMGSSKFNLKGYRGNNKPFSQMTSRGLIGASMNDTDGYSQPDYGSSMYYEDGASIDPPKSSTTLKRPSGKYDPNFKGDEGVKGGHRVEITRKDGSKTKGTEMNNTIYINGRPVSKKDIMKAGQRITSA